MKKYNLILLFILIYSCSFATQIDSTVYCIGDTIINKNHIVINRYPQSIGIFIKKNNKEIKKIISYDRYDNSCEPDTRTNDIWINGTKQTSIININDSTYFFSIAYPNCVCCYSELKSFYITKNNQIIEFKNDIGIYRYFLIINSSTKKYLKIENVYLDKDEGNQNFKLSSSELGIKKTKKQELTLTEKDNKELVDLLIEDPMSKKLINKLFNTLYLK